jgi:phosphomannomutase
MNWLESKLLLKKKPTKALQHVELITVELEVDGKLINRVSKTENELRFLVTNFYEQYGRRGKVFIIRESKMNFTSLLNRSLKNQ